jgi:hypothetical protein
MSQERRRQVRHYVEGIRDIRERRMAEVYLCRFGGWGMNEEGKLIFLMEGDEVGSQMGGGLESSTFVGDEIGIADIKDTENQGEKNVERGGRWKRVKEYIVRMMGIKVDVERS